MRVARAALVISLAVVVAYIVVGNAVDPASASPLVRRLGYAVVFGAPAFALVVQGVGAVSAVVALIRAPALRTWRGVAVAIGSCILALLLAFATFVTPPRT